MKLKKLLFLFFIFISLNSYSQVQNLNEDETLTLISSEKWYLAYVIFDGEKEIDSENTDWVHFHRNGVHEYTDEGDYEKGKWSYNHNTYTLTTNDLDGVIEYKIISLSKTEFVLENEWTIVLKK